MIKRYLGDDLELDMRPAAAAAAAADNKCWEARGFPVCVSVGAADNWCWEARRSTVCVGGCSDSPLTHDSTNRRQAVVVTA